MKPIYVVLVLLFGVNFSFAQISFIKYKAERGETIAQIANKFNVDKDIILKFNPDLVSGKIRYFLFQIN